MHTCRPRDVDTITIHYSTGSSDSPTRHGGMTGSNDIHSDIRRLEQQKKYLKKREKLRGEVEKLKSESKVSRDMATPSSGAKPSKQALYVNSDQTTSSSDAKLDVTSDTRTAFSVAKSVAQHLRIEADKMHTEVKKHPQVHVHNRDNDTRHNHGDVSYQIKESYINMCRLIIMLIT